MSPNADQSFHWEECAEFCAELAQEQSFTPDEKRRCFVAPGAILRPPLVLPIPEGCTTLEQYVETLPDVPGLQIVLLMQAGASSLAIFEACEALRTKTIKRYVVRGKGRAQPTHLSTKGKSRYGSRLRLQNAKLLLEETSERLHDWYDEYGEPEQIYYNCPVRLWADFFQTKPAPPFAKGEPTLKIPLDLPVPTTEVLLRTYRKMSFGSLVASEEAG